METNTKSSITDKIIEGLKKTIVEIEELRVQAALGKAEAEDAYEDLKKRFNTSIHEAKIQYKTFKNNPEILDLVNSFEHLQVQLSLGLTETRELFEEQKKKISKSINKLEETLRQNTSGDEYLINLHMELEKFKVKLELLALQYKLKKITAQYDFEHKKKMFRAKLNDLRHRLSEKETTAKEKWSDFREDISEAFTDLRKSFSS